MKICPKVLFKGLEHCLCPALIPLLSTLDKFSPPDLYVLFCLEYSFISVLPRTVVDVMTLRSGHMWPLSFDRYKSMPFHSLFAG